MYFMFLLQFPWQHLDKRFYFSEESYPGKGCDSPHIPHFGQSEARMKHCAFFFSFSRVTSVWQPPRAQWDHKDTTLVPMPPDKLLGEHAHKTKQVDNGLQYWKSKLTCQLCRYLKKNAVLDSNISLVRNRSLLSYQRKKNLSCSSQDWESWSTALTRAKTDSWHHVLIILVCKLKCAAFPRLRMRSKLWTCTDIYEWNSSICWHSLENKVQLLYSYATRTPLLWSKENWQSPPDAI